MLSVQVHSETVASPASSRNCRHWATGLAGRQTARSRPSDRRWRTPNSRACCNDVTVWWHGGGWKIKVADDWQQVASIPISRWRNWAMVNFGGETKKNTRISTHLKHILNVTTLKYNSKYLIIQKITNKFPSSVFNHRLNTLGIPSMCLNSHSTHLHHYHWLQKF